MYQLNFTELNKNDDLRDTSPFFTMQVVNRTTRIHIRLISMVNNCMKSLGGLGGLKI